MRNDILPFRLDMCICSFLSFGNLTNRIIKLIFSTTECVIITTVNVLIHLVRWFQETHNAILVDVIVCILI